MIIIDVSNPAHPLVAGFFPCEGLYDVVATDSYAYLADIESGLRIIDVSNPNYPIESALLNLPDAMGVDVKGSLAYVAAKGGLSIVDISDPAVPAEIGYVPTTGGRASVDVCISDEYVYMAYGDNLQMIEVSNSNRPQVVGHLRTGPNAMAVTTISNNSLLLSCGFEGIYILQNDLLTGVVEDQWDSNISHFDLFQNYPNPFNTNTDIRYHIPDTRGKRQETKGKRPGRTTLKIFNILGQEVRMLVDEPQGTGHYSVTWDGRDDFGREVVSGVYLYRLKTVDSIQTKKMALIR